MADLFVDEPVRCMDPECPEEQPSAQPEMDGNLLFYACPCGYEFPAGPPAQQEGACAAGVPEDVRIRYSASQPPGVVTLESGQDRRSAFLGPTIGRRPS